MNQATWDKLTPKMRDAIRSYEYINPQLTGLEGWQVEVTDDEGLTYRFIVGQSTGWKPCHIELKTARSSGGPAARSHYASIRAIKKIRG